MNKAINKIDLVQKKMDLLNRAHELVLELYESLNGEENHRHSIKKLGDMNIDTKQGAKEFCEFVRKNFQIEPALANLFLYEGKQINPNDIDEFRKNKPLGLCGETFDRYTNYHDSEGSKKVDQNLLKGYLGKELTNYEIAKFNDWRKYLQLPGTHNGKDIDQSIQKVMTYMTNEQAKRLVKLLIKFEPSPLAGILINVFLGKMYTNENFDGNQCIDLLEVWLININNLAKEVVDRFNIAVTTGISTDKQELLDTIFVPNTHLNDTATPEQNRKMIDFIRFIGKYNIDLLEMIISAKNNGQTTYQNIKKMNFTELEGII